MDILNKLFLAVILGLGGWIWYQGSTIDEMTAKNQAQAQTIKQQEEANQALNVALQQERDAVIAQQQRNDEIERVATENAESVKTIIKTQPCAHTRLPQSALDRLYK
nr:MAG TPA: Protein of unknown function (DUF2570) [Bacteriophage sp.]DAV02568.1 MAG TPA: Protein of unknown function (DUF2570) [Bacteriophage sp.]